MTLDDAKREVLKLQNSLNDLQAQISSLSISIHKLSRGQTDSSPYVPSPFTAPQREARESRDNPPLSPQLESTLGIRWLVVMGTIALLIAAGFGVRLAIDRGWVTPSMRCMGVAALGLALFSGGYYLRRTYERYGEVLMSGGVVATLIAVYAAHSYYHLMPGTLALALVVALSFSSAVISWNAGALAPIYLGLLGCYSAPMLVETFGDSLRGFLFFVTVLNLAYLVLAVAVDHLPLYLLALYSATGLYAFAWFWRFRSPSALWQEAFCYQVFQAVCFGIAAVVPALRSGRGLPREKTWALVPAILFFYGFAGDLILDHARNYHFIFALGVVVFLMFLSQYGRSRLKLSAAEHEPTIMAAFTGLLISAHLIGKNLHHLWEIWGYVALWYSCIVLWWLLKRPLVLLITGMAALAWLLLRVTFAPEFASPASMTPFLNAQFLILTLVGATLLGSGLPQVQSSAKEDTSLAEVLFGFAHLIMLRALYLQVVALHLTSFGPFVVTLFWVGYASAVLALGMRFNREDWRSGALWIYGLCTVKVFLYDTLSANMAVKTASYFCLGVTLVVAGYFYQRLKTKT